MTLIISNKNYLNALINNVKSYPKEQNFDEYGIFVRSKSQAVRIF